MAKKKKQTRKKVEEPTETPVFFPIAGGILLMLAALFMLMGGFGTGGPLPKTLFHGAYWTFGVAAYFSPIVLAYLGYLKFAHEEHRIPFHRQVSSVLLLVAGACWFFVSFGDPATATTEIGPGGKVGYAIGNSVLGALDKLPASILFMVVGLLAFFFTFGISLEALKKLGGLFGRSQDEEGELAALKSKADPGFTLNEGVPVEHGSAARLGSFRNTAEKMTPTAAAKGALTTTSDPDWQFPSIDLLNQKQDKANAGDVEGNAKIIKETFENFNINVEMEGANIGPRVTQYTLKPPAGVKLTKIAALDNNLSLDLAAQSIRVEAPIPGKRAVGIEVPNLKAATVRTSSIFSSQQWQDARGQLSFAIGKDISGTPVVADLDKMPHLLVAGQTNSGKSVMINTILTSLLYRNSPSDLKLILVDPKHVELAPYDEIPHLLTSVITEPEKCISALKWAVVEMERRYKQLAEQHKRNITEYNQTNKSESMPYIVIVIDELADLMMMAARDVEALIVRIAQKARAVGIHLVIATQRPSVDIITGLIKANIPARIAFTVTSQVDSRTIIDQAGAEKLLGQGDMLLSTADMAKPKRVQGALIEGDEVGKVADFLRMQRPPQYDDEIISQPVQLHGRGSVVSDYGANEADDDMWRDAVRVVIEGRKASTSLLQRRLRVGYARAARLIEAMEEQGIVGPADGSRPREVLISSLDEAYGEPAEQAGGDAEAYAEKRDDDAKEEYLTR